MAPVIFYFGGLPITTWPVFALIGVCVGYFVARADLKKIGFTPREITRFFILTVCFGLAGASGLQWLTVGSQGLVLYGAVLTVLALGALSWKLLGWQRRISLHAFFDLGSRALFWVLGFVRLGCSAYGCCYGTPSGQWPGVTLNFARWDFRNRGFPEGLHGIALHPAALYEAIVLFGLAIWMGFGLSRRGRIPGVFGYLGWIVYALVRFFLEFIRADERGEPWLGLSPSQVISVVFIAALGMMLFWVLRPERRSVSVLNK